MRRILPLAAALAAGLLTSSCTVFEGGGSGVTSPFFDGTASRRNGTVDGWVATPSSGANLALTAFAYPPDLAEWRPIAGARVQLDGGSAIVTDEGGCYVFGSAGKGDHALRVEDPTGEADPFDATLRVEAAAITSGVAEPIPPPAAPSVGYFPTGTSSVLRLQSISGLREWRRIAAPTEETRGAYRFAFAPSTSSEPDRYLDLVFSESGVALAGGPWGRLDPPTVLLDRAMRLNDRFSQSSTLTTPAGGSFGASVTSTVAGVDDLVLAGGRFDNTAQVTWSLSSAGGSDAWTMWLAYRVGPVKIRVGGLDYLLQSRTSGS